RSSGLTSLESYAPRRRALSSDAEVGDLPIVPDQEQVEGHRACAPLARRAHIVIDHRLVAAHPGVGDLGDPRARELVAEEHLQDLVAAVQPLPRGDAPRPLLDGSLLLFGQLIARGLEVAPISGGEES